MLLRRVAPQTLKSGVGILCGKGSRAGLEQGEEGEEAAVCGVCVGEIVIVREVTVNMTERAHVERRLIWRHQRCQFIATIMAEQETSSMEIDEVKLLTWC